MRDDDSLACGVVDKLGVLKLKLYSAICDSQLSLASPLAWVTNPEGPERHLDATRHNFCRAIAVRLPSVRGFKSGKEKHININKFAGLSRVWVGAKNLFMCFFRVIPYGGKTHKQNSPKNPGTIP